MGLKLKRHKFQLSKKDIDNLSCFLYNESNGLLATAFFNFPLSLKRHSVQVGIIAGRMALHAPKTAIPTGVTEEEYAHAVCYGCLYHDIGAYLVYNQHKLYPAAGERFLREQLSRDEAISEPVRKIILELVAHSGERHDGGGYPNGIEGDKIPLHAGICAVADEVDNKITHQWSSNITKAVESAKKYIHDNQGAAFSHEAVECFKKAYEEIHEFYHNWKDSPPFWNNEDVKPMSKPHDEQFA